MILIFSFYATNFRFHFHPLHYLHFAPIMNAFSFYFPPFLAFLNAERNMILSVRISQEFLSQIKSCPRIEWYVHNSKGQLISKQDCQATTSPKKRTLDFCPGSLLLQG